MNYTPVYINISDNQREKIKRAINAGEPVSIRLGNEDLVGSDAIGLTQTQIKRMIKAQSAGTGVTLKLSKNQLA